MNFHKRWFTNGTYSFKGQRMQEGVLRLLHLHYMMHIAFCAFDTVDHTSLLSILEPRFSVTGQSLAWFRSYLTDRAQVFTTLSSPTSPILLTSGIPQGSGLGPTRFISYAESTTPIFFHAHRPISSVCRRFSILWSLFSISSSVSANPSLILCRWPRKLVRFSSTAA